MHDAATQRDLARGNAPESTSLSQRRRSRSRSRSRSRRDPQGNRKPVRESKKLEKRRTYSFSSGQNDSIVVARDTNRPPVPPIPANLKGKGRADMQRPEGYPAGQTPLQPSTQHPESMQDWQRVPTLHKRSGQEMSRRKSSKKRKEEHDREAEIKAMVASVPVRPATDADSSGRPMKRESKKMHEGLNRNLQNPSSDISLPMADSIHSSLTSDSGQSTTFKVSVFDMLAPRPTIRYAENPRYGPGSFTSDRPESRKRKASERITIPEETLKANKRVDDLADDLNSGELRELMERDQKRRENKKIAEKIRMEQKIARRQAQQREDEATAERTGTPPPANMERGVLGREVVGLGIESSGVVTSSERKSSTASESRNGKQPANASRADSASKAHYPNDTSRHSPNPGTKTTASGSEHPEPVIEVTHAAPVVKGNISPPSSPTVRAHTRRVSSISQMIERAPTPTPLVTRLASVTPSQSDLMRKASVNSNRGAQSWTSIFRRGTKSKHGPTPSSFSNTSRDSVQNGQVPQMGYTPPVRIISNAPKRTMSKFREDLPEFPMSPPESRVQSPEADVIPPIREDYLDKKSGLRESIDEPHVRYDTPTSGYRSLDTGRLRDETPTSGHRSVDAPSPEPVAYLSQSLASIDSEGSWLSGRHNSTKRGSIRLPSHPLRDSVSSLHKRYMGYSESAEELGIVEDEYFSRLTPGPESQYRIKRQSTGNPMPSSDEEDGSSLASPVSPEKTKWGAVARHPTVVHREPRIRSREGLLNDFEFDSSSDPPGETSVDIERGGYGFKDSGESYVPGVHRATSVNLSERHVRHISAGSARLLDLKAKASGDGTRPSFSSDRA
jgi:hypothetical protein